MTSASSQFAKKSIGSIAAQFLTLGASLLAAIITARALGAEGRGHLTLVLLIPMLATSLGRMGISHAVNFFVRKHSRTQLIVNSFVLSALISVLLVVLALPAVFGLRDMFFKGMDSYLLIVAVLAIPLYVFINHLTGLLQAFYKIELCNLLLVFQAVVNVLLLLVLMLALKFELRGAVMAAVGSSLLAVMLSGLFLVREVDLRQASLDFGLMRDLLGFGFKSHIGNVLKDLSYRLDIFLISYFLSAQQVGYYVIAVTVAEVLWKIPDAVGGVLLPRIAQLDRDSAKSFTPVVTRLVLIPVFFGCLVVMFGAEFLIELAFGGEFVPAAPVLLILLPGILAFTVWKMLANDLIAQGYPAKYSATSAVALVTMVVMNVLLTPRFGLNGAAVASTLSYMTATICMVWIYRKITGNSLAELVLPRYSDWLLMKSLGARKALG